MKQEMVRFLLNFFKSKNVYAGVPVIIQNSKGEILLGKRRRNMATFPGFWGLPGGMPNYKEKLVDTAKREVKEELGVDIKIIKKSKDIYENFPCKKSGLHSVDVAHYGKIIKGIPKPKDETSEIKWFKPSEIRKMNLAYEHKKILKGEGLI